MDADCTVPILVVVLAVVVGTLGAAFWAVLRADSNESPALGTNYPYPEASRVLDPVEEAPDYLPTPVISEAEEFRRDAHRYLADNAHPHPHPTSWMEAPGAVKRAGLVDAPEDPPPQ
jgi:hypothetical protein